MIVTTLMEHCKKKLDTITSSLKQRGTEDGTEPLSSEQKMRLILSKSFFPVDNWEPESDNDKEILALFTKITQVSKEGAVKKGGKKRKMK